MEKTIPLEIVIRDENSPTPTPTPNPSVPGENTNITVPDTGVVDISNSFVEQSTAIIIISILIVGAAIALLARRYHKRKISEVDITRQERKAAIISSTITVLTLTIVIGQLAIACVAQPLTTSAASGSTDDSINDGKAELDVDSKITIVAIRTEDSDVTVATTKNTSTATSYQIFGYRLAASMTAKSTTANLYLNGDETSEYYIAPVKMQNEAIDGEAESLTANTWGYTLTEDESIYLPIPLATDPAIIVKGNEDIDDKPVDIYYTIQVDKNLPAGTYTGELKYTLTDNSFPSTLSTMQAMTPKLCEDTFTPGNKTTDPVPTATLTDTRDDKTYTVAKLADGNCWMTQNLDLDLDTNTELTPADTNISANWTPMRNTINFTGELASGWENDYYTPYSANPGDIYYYSSGTSNDDDQYASLADCQAAHPDCSAHNHAGNYYNWSAAVASNDTSSIIEQFSNAEGSICPAGWRLPVDRNVDSWTEGNELDAMVSSYKDIVGEAQIGGGGTYMYRSYLENGFSKIRTVPLWLVRTGNISYGWLSSIGYSGGYWSSTADGSDYAYQLSFFSGNVSPANSPSRYLGQSIRCVAE